MRKSSSGKPINLRDPRLVMRIIIGVLLAANLAAAIIAFKPFGGSADDLRREQDSLRTRLAQLRNSFKSSQLIAAKVETARNSGDSFMAKYILDSRTAGLVVDQEIHRAAEASGSRLTIARDQRAACAGARIVYAKSWGAKQFYGRTEDDIALRQQYKDWRIDEEMMRSTDDGWFMHCLPVRRNVVVTDGVLDGPQCAAIDEAENRLHVQKAVLASILQ